MPRCLHLDPYSVLKGKRKTRSRYFLLFHISADSPQTQWCAGHTQMTVLCGLLERDLKPKTNCAKSSHNSTLGLNTYIHHIHCASANMSHESVPAFDGYKNSPYGFLCARVVRDTHISAKRGLAKRTHLMVYAKRLIIVTMMTKSGIECANAGGKLSPVLWREQQKLTTLVEAHFGASIH